MSGYHKLISKGEDFALVDIPGWEGHGVVLRRRRLERLKRDMEELQRYVHGDGHHLAHVLWEEFSALLSRAERRE
jgi:hypothetical protein